MVSVPTPKDQTRTMSNFDLARHNMVESQIRTNKVTDVRLINALRRVPSNMSYNVSMVDTDGRHATVFVAPDRPAEVNTSRVCTNHQTGIEWPEHATLTATEERKRFLEERVDDANESFDRFVARFHEPPLFLTGEFRRWRTLYTAVYLPKRGTCEYRWPDAAWRTSVG